MKKSLPAIRVEEETIFNMQRAINLHNEKSLIPLSLQEFRRLAYETLSQIILQNKKLPIKIK